VFQVLAWPVPAARTMELKVVSKAAAASPARALRRGPSVRAQGWGRVGFGSAPAAMAKAAVLRMCSGNNSASPVTKYVWNSWV
jgi:hypothetical protein